MSPDDKRHGTYAGYIAHALGDRTPCTPCKDAQATYKRRLRARHYLGRSNTVTLDPTGTRRRVQALVAIGHTLRSLDREMGWARGSMSRWMTSNHAFTTPEMATKVAEIYDRLSMTVPQGWEAERARTRAARQGWAPPLAWDDDIDDPAARPHVSPPTNRTGEEPDPIAVLRAVTGDNVPLTRAERLTVVQELHRLGLDDRQIGQRAGIHRDQVARDRRHLGLPANFQASRASA